MRTVFYSNASRASVASRSASKGSGVPPGEARGFAESRTCRTCRYANPRANADLHTGGRSGSQTSMVAGSSDAASWAGRPTRARAGRTELR